MTQNLRELSAAPIFETEKPVRFSGLAWGYVFAAVGTVFFSMKSILVKLAYLPSEGFAANELDAITIMALRLGFSMPVYIAVFFILTRRAAKRGDAPPKKRDMALAAATGVLGYYVCAWLDIEGLKYITSQLERLLLFTYPVFVFVFGALFFGKPLTKPAVLAIVLAYIGIGIIFLGGDIAIGTNVPLGTAMVLACAAAFAFFQLFAKPMIGRLTSPVFTCCAMAGAGTAIFFHFLGVNIASGTLAQAVDLPLRIWGLGVSLAVLSTLLPTFMVNIAIGRIGPQATSAIGMISPIATIILAIWLLGEPFGWLDGLGTSVTIFGIGVYTWFDRRAQAQSHPNMSAPRTK